LKTEENIRKASFLAMENGADFIKTSTGKMEPAATPFAATVMCKCIAEYFKQTGRRVGFKPAGGIVTSAEALEYHSIVKEILGEQWLTPSLFRIGASRLANNLLKDILSQDVAYF
jgi:deoxyribose-phosphate aldolase